MTPSPKPTIIRLYSLKRLHIITIEVATGVDTGMGNKATQDWEAITSQGARKELWQL